MRHRIGIAGLTGLGNPSPPLLNNQGKIDKEFAKDAVEEYFSYWEGFDFGITDEGVMLGIEPAYQYEKLLIVYLAKDKSKSYLERGIAWGSYGTQLVSKKRTYAEYKNKSKFIKFIDKWHKSLFT